MTGRRSWVGVRAWLIAPTLIFWMAGNFLCVTASAGSATDGHRKPLPTETLRVQGLTRTVRYVIPGNLASEPALVIALHGSGGDGERFRRLTSAAFDALAREHGFVLAYPDALGGQWNDCRARAPYHRALAGVDDAAFLEAVRERARSRVGRRLAAVFVVGYSNGGHMVFRLALETPRRYDAYAAIGAHLPVPDELDCLDGSAPVSMMIVSGTEDPINPWAGGEVRAPDGAPRGRVQSAAATAAYLRTLAVLTDAPEVTEYPDRDPGDGSHVTIESWGEPPEATVALMSVAGGGHSLPHPHAAFPQQLVGRTARDIDGARAIWEFFARHINRGPGTVNPTRD